MRIKLNIQRFANSGQCVTSTNSDGSYFYVNWQQASQDIANNKTTINYQYGVYCGVRYYSNAVRIDYVNINGTEVKGSQTYSNFTRGSHELGSGSMEISHNQDGTKTFNINLSGWTWGTTTVTGSKDFALNNIPRYAVITQNMSSETETSITMNWSTDSIVDYIWYSTDNGANYTAIGSTNGKSGSYTITGLTPDTTYQIKTKARRKDSQLSSESAVSPIATYDYPKLGGASQYTIGVSNYIALAINNPLNKEVTVSIIAADNRVIKSVTGQIGSYMMDFNSTEIDNWYYSIPNSPSGTYSVKVETPNSTKTSVGNTYQISKELCAPLFDDFTLADVDEDTRALTDNNRYQIVGYSDMAAIIYPADKGVAQKGATMSKYRFAIGDSTPVDIPYSENLEVSEIIDNAPAGTFKVWAVDSRDNATLVTKVPERVIQYTNIQKSSITATRQNDVGETVTLSFSGTFWNDKFGATGAVDNSITNVRYRYKKTTEDWGSTWNGQTSIVPTTTQGSNIYSFNGSVKGDTNAGFEVAYSYNIEVEVSDELSKTTFSVTLGSGTPNMAIAEGGVSINSQYDDSLNDGLQVTGSLYLNGKPVGSIPQQDTAPSNPEEDDLWIDTDDAGFQLQVDSAVSTTSTNPIENQAITNYVSNVKLKTAPSMIDSGWMKICNIKFNQHNQGEFVYLKIFIGDGNNGETNQNAFIDFTGQLGWTGAYNGRMGCNADLHPQSTSFNTSNVFMKVIANSNIDYDIWLKTTSYYNRPNFLAYGSNQTTIIPSFDKQSYEPSGIACNLYMTTY